MGSETAELRPPKGSWGPFETPFGEAGHRSTSLFLRRELVGKRFIPVVPELPSAASQRIAVSAPGPLGTNAEGLVDGRVELVHGIEVEVTMR